MRLPRIDAEGFRRIAQAAPALQEAPAPAPEPQVDLIQLRRDVDTLHQWIDYFSETNLATQQEMEALQSQVEFLEEYLYSTSGQPAATPAAEPTPTSTGYATDYDPDAFMSYLQTMPYPPTLY